MIRLRLRGWVCRRRGHEWGGWWSTARFQPVYLFRTCDRCGARDMKGAA